MSFGEKLDNVLEKPEIEENKSRQEEESIDSQE